MESAAAAAPIGGGASVAVMMGLLQQYGLDVTVEEITSALEESGGEQEMAIAAIVERRFGQAEGRVDATQAEVNRFDGFGGDGDGRPWW